MNYKDVEWWACCAFIIIIIYTLGTLTGFPAWLATDSKLSVMTDVATVLASFSATFATFYAYKSYNSWKEQQSREQSILLIKELAHSLNSVVSDFWVTLEDITDYNHFTEKLKKDGDDKLLNEQYDNAFKGFMTSQDTFMRSCASLKATYMMYQSLQDKKINNINAFYVLIHYLEDLTQTKEHVISDSVIKKVSECCHVCTLTIENMTKELLQN